MGGAGSSAASGRAPAGIGGSGAERRNRKRLCGPGLRVQPQPLPSALLSALGVPCYPGVPMGEAEKFHYVYSCDLDINVQLKM